MNLAARFSWFPVVSYGLPVLANNAKSICIHGFILFQLLIGAYKSREVNFAAQFTWFLMVSYGLSVLAHHGKSICRNDLLGLLLVIGSWETHLPERPVGYRCYHVTRCTFLLQDLLGFLWFPMAHLCVQKENDFSKRFPWFLILSVVFRSKVPGFLHLELF